MEELVSIKNETHPVEILFVADAMTGQDAVRSAEEFHRRVGITGVMLTKMDGDARGGAALSIKQVTGQPVKFVGVGEKYDALEPFYPDRVAQRILGMGDVLSLIEEVQSKVDQAEAEEQLKKLQKNEFTLRRLSFAAAAGQEARLFLKDHEDASGSASRRHRHAAVGRRANEDDGEGAEAHRIHHRFDDLGRAQRSSDPERESPAPHRARFGNVGRRASISSSSSTPRCAR